MGRGPKPAKSNEAKPSGQIIEARGDSLRIGCGEDTVLEVLELQSEGGRRMTTRDFLNGSRLNAGEKLGLDN